MHQSFKTISVVALVAIGAAANADVAFTDLGPGSSFLEGSGQALAGSTNAVTESRQDLAFSFVSGLSGTMSQIDIGLHHISGTDGLTLSLFTDNGSNQFDSLLGSWSVGATPDVSDFTAAPVNVDTLSSNVQLTSGTKYWLLATTASSDFFGTWNSNSQGAGGTGLFSLDGTSYIALGGPKGAFRVRTQPVPEPATLAALALGLVALKRRRPL